MASGDKVVGSNPSPATKLSSIKLVLKARHIVGLFLFVVGQIETNMDSWCTHFAPKMHPRIAYVSTDHIFNHDFQALRPLKYPTCPNLLVKRFHNFYINKV